MKFAVYSRKSVYTGKGESVENQAGMCRQYIFAKFDGVTDADITVYEDEGFSAKNTQRPRFQQMLRDLRQKEYDYVVCYRLDRLSRNVSDFSALIEELNNLGVSFICIKEEFDTSKPMGKAMMYMASVFAQLERETIAERVRDNMMMLARTGRWLGGTTPTGFTSEKTREIVIDGKIKTACKLKPIPDEIAVVKKIFDTYLETRSVSGVSKTLIRQNIRSRSGKLYSLPGIKEILQNPVYCIADREARAYFISHNADVCFEDKDCSGGFGLLSYNKRDYRKRQAPRLPMEKWVVAIGKHKGVIPGGQWVAIQNTWQEDKPGGKRPTKEHNGYALFSGHIFCEKCGNRMIAKVRGNNPALFDYICAHKMRGGKALCDCRNIGGKQADSMIWESLTPHLHANLSLYRRLEKLKKRYREQETASTSIIMEDIADALSGLQDIFSEYRITEKRILCNMLIHKMVWTGEELHIFLAG